MPYCQIGGFIGKISKYEPGLVAADFTTLFRRISKFQIHADFRPTFNCVVVWMGDVEGGHIIIY